METLFKINEQEVPYRFNNISGPKYLLRGPRSDFGLVQLMPGEDFQTHYHGAIEENFFTLEGSVELHVNEEVFVLNPGDLCHVPPHNPHYLINKGSQPWKAVFSKSPFDEKDKIDVKWKPGDTPVEIG
jgi:mannose-6-phosphate isomerase-like protein (cupin superfamily)